jgi:HlyD family type I secretion membrane fusion protein
MNKHEHDTPEAPQTEQGLQQRGKLASKPWHEKALALLRPLERSLDKRTGAAMDKMENPRRIVRQGLVVLAIFLLSLLAWAAFGHISSAVVAPGKVKLETERKTVQHLEGGIVESSLVREGEEVKAGQTLIVLESIRVDSSVDLLRKQLAALMAERERLAAEKNMQEDVVWSADLQNLAKDCQAEDVLTNERKIFQARRDALLLQVEMLHSQASQIEAQISGLDERRKAEKTILSTIDEELAAKRQLYSKRYMEMSQILELERLRATHKGTGDNLVQSIAEATQKLAETRLRAEDLKNRFVQDASSKMSNTENEILQIRERLRPLRDAKTRLNVVAPVDGRVVGLKVHSRGGVVRSGDPLMDIVPENKPLIVEVNVPVERIAEVHVGQHAQVQLDAFDTRVTPLIQAKVVYVSADRMEMRTPQGMYPYYICHVEIDPKSLNQAGAYLSPGMPATVFITAREQTVLYKMFEPIIKGWEHALRD